MQYTELSFVSILDIFFKLTNIFEQIGILLNSIEISFLCIGHIILWFFLSYNSYNSYNFFLNIAFFDQYVAYMNLHSNHFHK